MLIRSCDGRVDLGGVVMVDWSCGGGLDLC